MITGESIPVHKKFHDSLFGSTVNQSGGVIYMMVTTYGSESALSQIVRLVELAQMNKAPVQDYADKLAGIFTPVILLIATITFLVWITLAETHVIPSSWFREEYNDPILFSMLFSISVVVISCPCALGLATPTAIMVGTTVGAQHGILIKGGSAFEMAHK
jgi:Cu+-exporting ATPase